ncbi:MAG: DUF1800 family protein, partial [Candidatus Eremiobacteraeota bacterium]|nr:DUF1800 family protein [Candidatus Eremiobacteraeota bacterium]
MAVSNRPPGQLDSTSALAPYTGPWNDRMAAHLLRRAGFGGSPQEVSRFSSMRMHDAVEALVHFPPANMPTPDVFDPYSAGLLPLARGQQMSMDDMARRQRAQDLRKEARQNIIALQQWWLNRMLTTNAPLQEKMTFFFHGHYTSAAIQKGIWPSYIFNQNQLFRTYALGNLRDLTLAVSKDPAMLIYLDNALSNAQHPNENYARELME